jgi:hypothetical protein
VLEQGSIHRHAEPHELVSHARQRNAVGGARVGAASERYQ